MAPIRGPKGEIRDARHGAEKAGRAAAAGGAGAAVPRPGQVAIAIAACGVCRTDLHVVDGDLTGPKLPLVPGHEIVGRVAALGTGVSGLAPRAGVRTEIETFPLAEANLALDRLRAGHLTGAAVLLP